MDTHNKVEMARRSWIEQRTKAQISNVDSRYSGPRWFTAKANGHCRELMNELNAAEAEALNMA